MNTFDFFVPKQHMRFVDNVPFDYKVIGNAGCSGVECVQMRATVPNVRHITRIWPHTLRFEHVDPKDIPTLMRCTFKADKGDLGPGILPNGYGATCRGLGDEEEYNNWSVVVSGIRELKECWPTARDIKVVMAGLLVV